MAAAAARHHDPVADPGPDQFAVFDRPEAGGVHLHAVAVDRIDEAVLAFHEAYKTVITGADERLAEQGLGRSHHKVLYQAARNPRCSVTEVREFIGVNRQAMQRPVNDLRRLGLIEMVAMPANRRVHLLVLTKKCAALEHDVTQLLRQSFEAAFGKVPAAGVNQWMAVMKAFVA